MLFARRRTHRVKRVAAAGPDYRNAWRRQTGRNKKHASQGGLRVGLREPFLWHHRRRHVLAFPVVKEPLVCLKARLPQLFRRSGSQRCPLDPAARFADGIAVQSYCAAVYGQQPYAFVAVHA